MMMTLPKTDPAAMALEKAGNVWIASLGQANLPLTQQQLPLMIARLAFPVASAVAQAQKPLLDAQVKLATDVKLAIFYVVFAALQIVLISLVYTGQIPFKPYMIGMLSFMGVGLLIGAYILKKYQKVANQALQSFEPLQFTALTPDQFQEKFGAEKYGGIDVKPYVQLANTHLIPALFDARKKLGVMELNTTINSFKFGQVFQVFVTAISALLLVLTFTGHIPLKTYMILTVTGASLIFLSQTCCRPCSKFGLNSLVALNQMQIDGNY